MKYAPIGSPQDVSETKQLGSRFGSSSEATGSGGLVSYGTVTGPGAMDSQTGTSTPSTEGARNRADRPDLQRQQRRDAMRRLLVRAENLTDKMVANARMKELTRLSNHAYELAGALQELWELRAEREDDWGDILNALQIALDGSELGQYTVDQCRAIKAIIADHLIPHGADGTNLEQAVTRLVESGLSPWKGIDSAESPTEE